MIKHFKLKGGEAYDCSKVILLYHLSCPPLKCIRWFQMSEAIISRRGYGPGGAPQMKTETIVSNTNYIVPKHKGNLVVRIFGAGGGGRSNDRYGYTQGAGGGWMNNGEFDIAENTSIQITIGVGGVGGGRINTGGSTAFGTYLSANGGSSSGGSGGGSTRDTSAGDGYQFGGGGSSARDDAMGGDGGVWGGGGGSNSCYEMSAIVNDPTAPGNGGNGGTYGGGGGGGCADVTWLWRSYQGGNGGTYGGGGGIGDVSYSHSKGSGYQGPGVGGTYGGNGGNPTISAQDGTNTSTWTNVAQINGVLLRGHGKAGGTTYAGGGGFGGNGGAGHSNGGGGGGGYGGNGGSYGGGGGGYGSNGGWYAGGGGGYGPGADGGWNAGGGGGYFSRGGNNCGGGGGYGPGGDGGYSGGIAAGGGRGADGGQGICIIQYYE